MLAVDPQQRAVRDDAIQAIVRARRRDHDHLAVGLREPAAFLLHQRIVVREERAKFVRTMRERDEHVRDEAGLFLHGENARADVVGKVGESCGTG